MQSVGFETDVHRKVVPAIFLVARLPQYWWCIFTRILLTSTVYYNSLRSRVLIDTYIMTGDCYTTQHEHLGTKVVLSNLIHYYKAMCYVANILYLSTGIYFRREEVA